MAIVLTKGQNINLSKTNPNLTKVVLGLGWDVNGYSGGHDYDLDASAFMLDASGKCTQDRDFVFYNNPSDPSNSVVSSGDNLTGEGDGDDETITVDLATVPMNIQKIAFTITIHDAQARGQNFGQVMNSYVRLMDAANGSEVVRYDLGEDYSIETAVVVCELYRHNGEWKFKAIGSGYQGGLASLLTSYGLS